MKHNKRITNKQLDKSLKEILFKINTLKNTLIEIEKRLPNKPLKYLKFEECVPPESICKDVSSMLNGISNYVGFIGKLSEYYGCEPMGLYIDEKINPKFIAEYRHLSKNAFTREPTCNRKTVLHEFFHHLCHLDVVIIDYKNKEKLADEYAKLFLQRAGYKE